MAVTGPVKKKKFGNGGEKSIKGLTRKGALTQELRSPDRKIQWQACTECQLIILDAVRLNQCRGHHQPIELFFFKLLLPIFSAENICISK